MKYMFIIIITFISTYSFADTQLLNCVIHYKTSQNSISQVCLKQDLSDRGTFSLVTPTGHPLGDDQEIAVIRSRNSYLQLIVKTESGEIYDLGPIRKDLLNPGCWENRYYTICLK